MQVPWTLSPHEPAADPLTVLSSYLSAPIYEGNRIDLLVNGRRIFPAMLDSIRNAKQSINLLTYIYGVGDIAKEFADVLAEAAERAVEVRVLIDAFGGLQIDDRLVRQMVDAGVQVARFHPLRYGRLGRWNNRTHRKVLVVDGHLGFTGGVGISEEWTGDAQDAAHWRDDHFRVTGPVVRALQGAFAENWSEATGELLVDPGMFPSVERDGNARVVPILGGPHATPDISLLYWVLIRQARRSIRIVTPYFVPTDRFMNAMLDAMRRGSDLELMLPDSHNDSKLVQYASRRTHGPLIDGGAKLLRFRGTLMHTKAMIVDDRWCVIGSPNMDTRSFELNYEIALLAESDHLVTALNHSFEADRKRCTEITAQHIEQRSALSNVRDAAAALLRRQL